MDLVGMVCIWMLLLQESKWGVRLHCSHLDLPRELRALPQLQGNNWCLVAWPTAEGPCPTLHRKAKTLQCLRM